MASRPVGYVPGVTTWQGLLRLDRERPWLMDAALALGLLAAALFAAAATGSVPVPHVVLMVVTAAVTRDAVEDLGLEVGSATYALVKSTEVQLAVD